MRGMTLKRIGAIALTGAMLAGLSACSSPSSPSEVETKIVLPEPSPEDVDMILGERIAAEPKNVSMYYVSGDGTSFSTVTRSIVASSSESFLKEAVNALLSSAPSPDRTAFIPAGVQALDVEYACGIATVNLSLDAHNVQSELEYMMLLASISNTLLSLDGVEGVNVLVSDRTEGIASLPVGAQTTPFGGITPAYAQMSAEKEYFLESETGTISRAAVLYFPAKYGNWLVPELREITFDSSDYSSGLIRALRTGPLSNLSATSAIPEGADLLVNNPVTEMTSTGERVVRLEFSPTLRNYLAFSGLEEWKLIGSVAMTIGSFVPEVDAIRVYFGDECVTSCWIGDQEIIFEEGLIRRSDFSNFVGSTLTLWLPKENGTFERIERAVSMARAQSPLSVLEILFEDILSNEEETLCFPEGVSSRDILGISVENGIAKVNLSGNFYRQAQALDATAERGVIYAIVNTLCELDDIAGVRFYIEGISAQTLSGSIYLRSVLLPNPGLDSLESSAVPEITATP